MTRANIVPFPILSRITAIANLLMNSCSHRLVAACETLRDLIEDVKVEIFAKDPTYELSIEELPALDVIFARMGVESKTDPFIPYPALITRPAISDVCMFLHSSGSTGLPKTIPQTHKTLLNWAASSCSTDYRVFIPRPRIVGMHLPPFHTLGLMVQILYALRARRTKSTEIITILSIIQTWSQDPKSVFFEEFTICGLCWRRNMTLSFILLERKLYLLQSKVS